MELDFGYMIGLAERGGAYHIDRALYNMHTNSLRLIGVYRLQGPFSLGAGAGMERYQEPGYNTLPVFATLRYTPLIRFPRGYVYTDVGYSIKTSTLTPGLLWDVGVGHQWMLRRHFGLKAQVGYNLKQFRMEYWTSELAPVTVSQWRHSLSLSVGLVF
jgi:hypothetical protein